MISTALLAGGRSRRMGRDKCCIEMDGVPLWRRQLALLVTISTDIMVISRTRPDWCPSNVRWVPDRVVDGGPLAAIDAGLAAAAYSKTLFLAVDLPEMTAEYLQSLVNQTSGPSGVAPIIGDFFQPLSAVYPQSAIPIVTSRLAEPDKSLQPLLRKLVATENMKSIPVSTADLPCFRNYNSPHD